MALLMSTATGFRSLAWASSPSRCASSGIAPPPANGSWKAGSFSGSKSSAARGWSALSVQARRHDSRISARAASSTSSFVVFSHSTSFRRIPNRRSRSWSCASSVGKSSGRPDGSSTSCANSTARAAANGRRAHHRCSVLGWPCRMDFSRAAARLMSSSGSATSMSLATVRTRAVMASLLSPVGPPEATNLDRSATDSGLPLQDVVIQLILVRSYLRSER